MATICLAPVFGLVWIAWILMVCGPEPDAPKNWIECSYLDINIMESRLIGVEYDNKYSIYCNTYF